MCQKENQSKDKKPNPKTATNNQWTNNHLKPFPDTRDRQDGPGGN